MNQALDWLGHEYTWIYLVAFLTPVSEAVLVVTGEWWFHAAYRTTNKYQHLIMQVTTVGAEYERVNEIISRLKSYNLPMPYEIWVIMEPGFNTDYPDADRVIVVPKEFSCKATHKARAQEYARRVRQESGIGQDEFLKILFLDDDVEPTRAYVTTGFEGDYDICQGITSPRIHYGRHGVKHFFLSHMDDVRYLACLIWCSFTQGVVKRPVYTHGEGLYMTAIAEQTVTWDFQIFASEDLVVGQNAAHLGLKWGWFHEYIELTSPWGWQDYLKQRRRWLWGNIHAVKTKGVLPTWGRFLVVGKYLIGFATFSVSLLGVILLLTNSVDFSPVTYVFCWGAFAAWTLSFGISGWVNAGRRTEEDTRSDLTFTLNRLWQAFAAALLAVLLITPTWTTVALLICLFRGNPGGFQVIRKTATSTSN